MIMEIKRAHMLELVDEQLINISIQVILCILNVYNFLIGENKLAIITKNLYPHY